MHEIVWDALLQVMDNTERECKQRSKPERGRATSFEAGIWPLTVAVLCFL